MDGSPMQTLPYLRDAGFDVRRNTTTTSCFSAAAIDSGDLAIAVRDLMGELDGDDDAAANLGFTIATCFDADDTQAVEPLCDN